MTHEELLKYAEEKEITIREEFLPYEMDGLYFDNHIILSSRLDSVEKYCVLAEELGHSIYNVSNLLNQEDLGNVKEELKARNWAYRALLPLEKIIECYKKNCESLYDMAEVLQLTEDFINEALLYYHQKYGLSVEHDGYLICFNPLGVMEMD